jgi:hypothetical protein
LEGKPFGKSRMDGRIILRLMFGRYIVMIQPQGDLVQVKRQKFLLVSCHIYRIITGRILEGKSFGKSRMDGRIILRLIFGRYIVTIQPQGDLVQVKRQNFLLVSCHIYGIITGILKGFHHALFVQRTLANSV